VKWRWKVFRRRGRYVCATELGPTSPGQQEITTRQREITPDNRQQEITTRQRGDLKYLRRISE
jgi:hypothetical protein